MPVPSVDPSSSAFSTALCLGCWPEWTSSIAFFDPNPLFGVVSGEGWWEMSRWGKGEVRQWLSQEPLHLSGCRLAMSFWERPQLPSVFFFFTIPSRDSWTGSCIWNWGQITASKVVSPKVQYYLREVSLLFIISEAVTYFSNCPLMSVGDVRHLWEGIWAVCQTKNLCRRM